MLHQHTEICFLQNHPLEAIVLANMLDWQDFDAVFQPKTDFAYDTRTVETILKHRKEFGDQLFFDRIWKLIGLSRRKISLSSICT